MFDSHDDSESPLGADPLDEGEDGGDKSFFSNSIPKVHRKFKILNLKN